MRNAALQMLADKLAADGAVSAEEVLELRQAVFNDGVVSREDAEVLIALAARVANSDATWAHAFVEALADHVLHSGAYPGHVDEATATWLIAQLGHAGPRESEVEAVLKILERAESAPESLSAFARERVRALLAADPIGAPETELIRRCLFASAGSGRVSVTEPEVRWLFALDAQTDGRSNAEAWQDLFVKGVLNHLMARRAPALLEANAMMARQAWLAAPTPGVFRVFRGMFRSGWQAKAKTPNELDGWETHFEAANAETAADSELTLGEIAWTVGMTKDDAKLTANEQALLAEIRKLEAEQAA